jgi:iron complex outermembrane receptor protein
MPRPFYRPPAGLLAISLFIGNSTAIAHGDGEDLYFSELPVVASVSRLPQRLDDAPTSVTVVDRDMIKASGARDLNDIFRLVPGFQTYPNNTDTARVSYHGLTDEDFSPRVQVLIDGRSQYSPLFRSGVNWAVLPVAIEDIERIEVVRGSNTASYGSNAFLGVINIITVDPALVRGSSLAINSGNQGVRDYTLRSGGKIAEAGNFRFTYQQKNDTGLADRGNWTDANHSNLLDLRGDLQLTTRDVLQFSASRIYTAMPDPKGRYAQMYAGPSDPQNPMRNLAQSSTQLQASWRRALSAGSDFQLRYAYTEDWAAGQASMSDGTYLYTTNNVTNGYVDGRGYRHDIEAQHNFRPFTDGQLVWGAGWRVDTTQALPTSLLDSSIQRKVGRLFGNLEWKPTHWFTGNLGASSEHDTFAGEHTSPRLSANFHLSPQNTLRLAYALAYRSGSAVDYRGNAQQIPYALVDGTPLTPAQIAANTKQIYIANPNLSAEKLTSWELGYLGDWKDWRMSLDVRLFREFIPNRTLIVFTAPDQTIAAQSVHIDGLEYSWKWHPYEPTRIMLNQAFTHSQAEFLPSALAGPLKTYSDSSLTNLRQMAEQAAPRHSTAMLLMQKLPYGFELSTAAYWVSEMKWTRNSSVYPYRRVDARLGYPFRWGSQGGELALTVQSLNGAHGEFKANGSITDRIVDRRTWLSARFDF